MIDFHSERNTREKLAPTRAGSEIRLRIDLGFTLVIPSLNCKVWHSNQIDVFLGMKHYVTEKPANIVGGSVFNLRFLHRMMWRALRNGNSLLL